MRLGTLVVVTNADGALVAETLTPEATDLNVGLGDALVGEEEPCTEDGLGEDVKDGVGNDLLVNVHVAGAIGDTPDTEKSVSGHSVADEWRSNLHGVDGPDDEGEATNGSEEVADLATLGGGSVAAVEDELPDNDEVGNAGNGVPAPLLGGLLRAERGEETSEDHDDVGNNGDQDVGTGKTSEQRKVEEEERGGDGPVDVASPVDLAVDVVLGVGDVLVVLNLGGLVVADTVAAGHGEVGKSGEGDDEGGQDVIQTLGLRCVLAVIELCVRLSAVFTCGMFQDMMEKTSMETVMTTVTTLEALLAYLVGFFGNRCRWLADSSHRGGSKLCNSSEAAGKCCVRCGDHFELYSASLQRLSLHVPEGPDTSVGGLLILGERGHDSGDGSNGAGSQQAGGGRGEGLYRVDNHDEGSVV
jgi:hypothetical protein